MPPSSTTAVSISAPYTTHPTPILTPSESTGDPLDNHHHHNNSGALGLKAEPGTEIKTHGANIDPALPASFVNGGHNGPAEYSQQQSVDALQLRGSASPFFSTFPFLRHHHWVLKFCPSSCARSRTTTSLRPH